MGRARQVNDGEMRRYKTQAAEGEGRREKAGTSEKELGEGGEADGQQGNQSENNERAGGRKGILAGKSAGPEKIKTQLLKLGFHFPKGYFACCLCSDPFTV